MSTELKKLVDDIKNADELSKTPERIIKNGLLITQGISEPETMQVEDLAALETLTEDNILAELQTKLVKGSSTSFVGDILLILNPNTSDDIYNETVSGPKIRTITIFVDCAENITIFFFSTIGNMNINQDLTMNLIFLLLLIVHTKMHCIIMSHNILCFLEKVNQERRPI